MVDGNSDDQTVALAKSFHTKLPHLTILTSPRRHVCTQRNLGAKSARADVLIFSDADNRLPSYFLQGIKYRVESTGSDIISCWLKPDTNNPKNDAIAMAINTFLELQNNFKPTYLLESMFVIKKNCFARIGGFDESINYAEGKSLIQTATKLGYRTNVVRDPVYTFSFRRFRKYGLLGVASRMAKMELSEILGPEFHASQAKKLYPMLGGSIFDKNKKAKNKFQKNIIKLLKQLKSDF